MKKNAIKILSEIKNLIDELESVIGGDLSTHKSLKLKSSRITTPKGASGAIKMLIDEGFFDTPKGLILILEKLKEIGHYHAQPTVAMNLLNFTKRRELNRLKNRNTKNWEYVIRK